MIEIVRRGLRTEIQRKKGGFSWTRSPVFDRLCKGPEESDGSQGDLAARWRYEENLSTQQPQTQKCSRFPRSHEQQEWP